MSRYDLDKHTGSCVDFLSNFKHELSYAQQKRDEERCIFSNKQTNCEEKFSSEFEHELNYAQQDTDEGSTIENIFCKLLAKVEHLSDMIGKLQTKVREIITLCDQITGLQKQIRSKNSKIEDGDFRLSRIENSHYDGSMIWKIPQFSQRKTDAENGKYTSISSLPFYSGRYGYKMCLRLYIMGDGIGKGTHLSLFFVVLRGEFDNILQWPFTHEITFKLVNQAGGSGIVDTFKHDPMSISFRKPKSEMNIASGCTLFISHAELEGNGFIVDDTIFIKCSVDTSTICHP